jgi:uncharacterized protein (TIGR02145 family)
MKKLIKISVLVLFVILVIIACKKENIYNPTNGKTTVVFNPNISYGSMTDQDGNVYKTVTIGTQTWMAENLRTTKYRDGTAIPNVTDFTAWYNSTTGAYCTYNNTTRLDSIATFGILYNGYAVIDSRNIAPAGWHVPGEAEWKTLTTYLGSSDSVAAGKMMEAGTKHWISPNTGATNESGFSATPAGILTLLDMFSGLGYGVLYWSSTQGWSSPGGWNSALWTLNLSNYYDQYGFHYVWCTLTCDSKLFGFAVRLVKD